MLDEYFKQYGIIAIFAAIAVALPTALMLISWILSITPTSQPTPSLKTCSEIKSRRFVPGRNDEGLATLVKGLSTDDSIRMRLSDLAHL